MTPHDPVSTRTARVLVTGATGYIGGRLVPVLEAAGVRLRCLARQPAALASRVSSDTEVVAGDLFDPASLDRALTGIDVAYYLVHSMGAHGDYRETDRVAAHNFGEAARRAEVRRIVYLGGLATGEETLSKHLKSRIETGQALRESGVPVVEFRASVVIGSGSLSFELIRALVERLPVMICPRWVSTLAQPIGVDDVLAYLASACDLPDGGSRTFEIGGADQASYGDVMREYARQRRLKRVMISVQFPPDPCVDGRHESQPQARQTRGQQWHRDHHAPQPTLSGVLAHYVAVARAIGPADFERAAFAVRQV